MASMLNKVPFANQLSYSDGPGNLTLATGVPYFYVSESIPSIKAAFKGKKKSNVVSIDVSLVDVCQGLNLDPQNPNCPQVTLVGKLVKVEGGDEGKDFLFAKHPSFENIPEGIVKTLLRSLYVRVYTVNVFFQF